MEEVILLSILGLIFFSFFYFMFSTLKLRRRNAKLDRENLVLKTELAARTDKKEYDREINRLMAENEFIKEDLRDIKYLLEQKNQRQEIDLEYEKEQMRLDNDQQKFRF